MISETHWSYTNELNTPHWHAIPTPSQKDLASGLLLLVATRLCRSATGRSLHCRLHLTPRPVDIIGVYQYPWNTSTVQKTRRIQVWSSLQQLLKVLPNRNTLCLLGEFNCSLPNFPRLVGQAHFWSKSGNKSGPQHGDMSTFSNMLTDFQLVALNTWTSTLGATSFSNSGSSRIDFVLVRQREADNQAKQVGLLEDVPFLRSGTHHIPMITSLNYRYFRSPRNQTLKFPRQIKPHCIDEFRHDTLH